MASKKGPLVLVKEGVRRQISEYLVSHNGALGRGKNAQAALQKIAGGIVVFKMKTAFMAKASFPLDPEPTPLDATLGVIRNLGTKKIHRLRGRWFDIGLFAVYCRIYKSGLSGTVCVFEDGGVNEPDRAQFARFDLVPASTKIAAGQA